jgi:predicted RNA-binding protein YlqC (UPF0109 family)
MVKEKLYNAGVARIEIERRGGTVTVNIHTARPGLVIGKKGTGIDALRIDLNRLVGSEVAVNIHEVRKPEMDAQLVAENIAMQLERRIAFRRAMKKSVTSALKFGAQGIKVLCGGRLAGAEIARSECIVKEEFRCRLFVLTSITARLKRLRHMERLVLNAGYTRVRFLRKKLRGKRASDASNRHAQNIGRFKKVAFVEWLKEAAFSASENLAFNQPSVAL